MLECKRIIFALCSAVMTVSACITAVILGDAQVNRNCYPVMGVDVSHYQGEIDWQSFEKQNISFAFVKATEGSSYTDEFAQVNLSAASETDIKVSAYHFFSFDSSGETQAENFISAVPKEFLDMPPVVDIEYYGDKKKNKPSQETVKELLKPLLQTLEEHYGEKPVIYTTMPVYIRYIKEDFSDYPLWIRNVWCEPEFVDWKFWQYSDKGELDGFEGEEKYIDLNVYNGSEEKFLSEFSEEGK